MSDDKPKLVLSHVWGMRDDNAKGGSQLLMSLTVGSKALTDGTPARGQRLFFAVPQELLSGAYAHHLC